MEASYLPIFRSSRLKKTRLRAALMAATLLVPACVTTDQTNDSRVSNLVHQCFQTVHNTTFYETDCPRGSSRDEETRPGLCNTVTDSNKTPYREPPPERPPPNELSKLMRKIPRKEEKQAVTILGNLPSGTSFEVTKMLRVPFGEGDSYWLTVAEIRDGEFKGKSMLLPWNSSLGFHAADPWITDFFQREPFQHSAYPPQIDLQSMTACADKLPSGTVTPH